MTKAISAFTRSDPPMALVAVGDRYGRLVAVQDLGRRKRKRYWLFRCDCGNDVEAQSALVRRGNTQSCGCFRREYQSRVATKHGQHRSPTYFSWQAMTGRCNNPNDAGYADYGGRGIRVCDRWLSFETFHKDMGDRPAGMTLDRRDVHGDYEPGNCRWATAEQQASNTRRTILVPIDGRTVPLTAACKALGVPRDKVYGQMRQGFSFEEALERLPGRIAPVGQNT